MLYGHYAGNNKSFPDFVQEEKKMLEKYNIHLECRNSGANYGNTRLYTKEEYEEFIKNLTDSTKDFVGVKTWKDTWHYVQKINIIRVEIKIRKTKDV